MKRRGGFTLIELLITITIMVVLLTLTVVSLRNNQASARDEKRRSDIVVIAQQLENYYRSGTDSSAATGSYPPTSLMSDENTIRTTLRDIDAKVLRAPDVASTSAISLINATSNSGTQTPAANTYIYQPVTSDGTLCTTTAMECRKFTLYFSLETSSGTQTLRSKNQ